MATQATTEAAEPASPERASAYRVTAPYITLRAAGSLVSGRGGYTVQGFYRAAILPPGAHAEDVARLLDAGMIEEV